MNDDFPTLHCEYSVEREPLGTGGAIYLACKRAKDNHVLVVNGDTLFKADLKKASSFHTENSADCTLLLKPMQDFDRYGAVELDDDYTVSSFKEKQYFQTGDINAGVYILNVEQFIDKDFPRKVFF
jgi:D-glycero-alpha-D-manno-heptose 1-phosphate guanylyltransferase